MVQLRSQKYLSRVRGGLGSSDLDRLAKIMDLDLLRVLPEYNLIRDCLLGEQQIKNCGTKYLPPPTDEVASTLNRYDSSSNIVSVYRDGYNQSGSYNDEYEIYKQRAVFWNFTQRHHQSLVGQMFVNEPKIEVPPELEPLLENVDGDNTTLIQFAKSAFGILVAYSRLGLYTDFPMLDRPATVANPRLPVLNFISPFKILAWQRNKNRMLSSVLVEDEYEELGMFTTEKYLQYRQLALINGDYMQAIYRPKDPVLLGALNDITCITPELKVVPDLELYSEPMPILDVAGMPFNEIPYEFVGAENNRETVDTPLFGPLASANLSDYRTSADLEQMLFLRGQPTVWLACADPQLFEQQYPDGVTLGSKTILQLGDGGQAGVVQIGDSDALSNNMKDKRERIADLGVLIHESTDSKYGQQTATEVQLRSLLNNSAIASAANNLSTAMTSLLKHAARFIGVKDTDDIEFQIDLTRSIRDIPVDERKVNLEEYTAGILSRSEVRAPLERAGKTHLTAAESQAEIDRDGLGELPMRQEGKEVRNDIQDDAKSA